MGKEKVERKKEKVEGFGKCENEKGNTKSLIKNSIKTKEHNQKTTFTLVFLLRNALRNVFMLPFVILDL